MWSLWIMGWQLLCMFGLNNRLMIDFLLVVVDCDISFQVRDIGPWRLSFATCLLILHFWFGLVFMFFHLVPLTCIAYLRWCYSETHDNLTPSINQIACSSWRRVELFPSPGDKTSPMSLRIFSHTNVNCTWPVAPCGLGFLENPALVGLVAWHPVTRSPTR